MTRVPIGRCGGARRAAGLTFLACAFVWYAQGALAQGPNRPATKFYTDFSDTADALLRNAAGHARDGQWAEAIEIYQRVIQQFGEKVAKLPWDDPAGHPSTEHILFVDLRQFCQRRLAALPAEARAIYRGRVDAQAERWYRQGAAERDRTLLRRVIDQAFCSSWGDDVLDLLGDLAFQDGRFDEALAFYRQLVPEPGTDRSGLVYPDPSVDLARVAAKKILCRASFGDNPPAKSDLDAYAKAYPGATGSLAGRTGPYLKILTEALGADHLAPPSQPDGRWPTFAGSPTRTKIVPGSIDVGLLQWKVELPTVDPRTNPPGRVRTGMGVTAPQVPADRLLAYHPIVLGDQVLVCDENRIFAYNLNNRPESKPGASPSVSVEPVWKSEGDRGGIVAHAAKVNSGIPRYTLTAHGDRIFARMGPTNWPFMPGMRQGGGEAQSYLLAVERSTEGKQLWKKRALDVPLPKRQADASSRSTGFEGTPVADGRSVYVAMTDRREQTATYVACLDAETGKPRWVRYLGAASSEADNMMGMGFGPMPSALPSDFGHRLLTLDGPTVYYQTNLGAVAALDAETGAIRWVATYPRIERNGLGEGNERDLNPAIVHDGLAIVAPDDASSIYAFDAGSGRLVWKTEPIPDEVGLSHLLGVAKGRLIATGHRVLSFDVKTGKLLRSWPDQGGGPAYSGHGRGILAGDKIYWPTRTEIHVLDQATGLRSDPSIKLQESYQTTGGNLSVGDGYLIVAQTDSLVVFCQNSRLIQRYREQIARAPDQASNYYRLAQAAEAVGEDSVAIEALALAIKKARPSETIDGSPLAEATRDHQFHLLIKLGNKSRAAKDWEQAADRYEGAAGAARSDRDRLAALLLLAGVQLDRGNPRASVKTLQELLADERIRSQDVGADDGRRTIRANLLIGDRLSSILRERGREVYDEFDRKAGELLARGRQEKDPRLLEEVGRSYPVATAVPDSLLALGLLHEGARRPAEAARAFKRLLASAPSDSLRARALWGLARAYEAQRLWVPSRDTYAQAQTRFPDEPMAELGAGAKLGRLVADRLSREPFDRMAGDQSEPSLPLPLVKRWNRPLAESVRPLEAEGVPPSSEAGRIFLIQGNLIRPVDPATGAASWEVDFGGTPVWVGYLADRIIAATETRIVALGLEKGAIEWQYDLAPTVPDRSNANPFVKPPSEAERADSSAGRFHHFHIMGGRVFCQSGDRKLLALDGDTGLVDWTYSPAAGAINPLLLIGPTRIVLQTRQPTAILVLDTTNGRRRAEHPHADDDEWLRPPVPIDDDRVALVLDRRTVSVFDLTKGTNAWVFRESDKLPTNGPPRLLGDAERLLLIHDGNELIRLDAATGFKRWSRPLGGEDLSEAPEALALDHQRFYWASDRTVRAASLADGALTWSRPLSGPESGWSIALTERCVMAYPRLGGHGESGDEDLPLILRRRDTGELVQRLVFPAAASGVAVRLAPRGALVASRGGLWALGEQKAKQSVNRNP